MKLKKNAILINRDDWMVINKPSGMHTVEGESEMESLEAWLRKKMPKQDNLPECGIVHRLDQRTSGCIVVAKTDEAYLKFRELIRSTEIKKTYLAIIRGKPRGGSFKLYFHSRYKRSQKVTVTESGMPETKGICRWKPLTSFRNRSLIEIDLIGRGKRHQIRAGLAHLGYPIAGDILYGGSLWREGFGLHAWKLSWTGITIEAPPPKNWPEELTRILEKQAQKI